MTAAYMTFNKQALAIKALAVEGKLILEGLGKYVGSESKVSEHFRVPEKQPDPGQLLVSLHGLSLIFRFGIRLGEPDAEGYVGVYAPALAELGETPVCEKIVITYDNAGGVITYVCDNPNEQQRFARDRINENILLAVAHGLTNKNLLLGRQW
jgi:hypothetical protein